MPTLLHPHALLAGLLFCCCLINRAQSTTLSFLTWRIMRRPSNNCLLPIGGSLLTCFVEIYALRSIPAFLPSLFVTTVFVREDNLFPSIWHKGSQLASLSVHPTLVSLHRNYAYPKAFLLHLEIEIHNEQCTILFSFLRDLDNARMRFLHGHVMSVSGKYAAFFTPKDGFCGWFWKWQKGVAFAIHKESWPAKYEQLFFEI